MFEVSPCLPCYFLPWWRMFCRTTHLTLFWMYDTIVICCENINDDVVFEAPFESKIWGILGLFFSDCFNYCQLFSQKNLSNVIQCENVITCYIISFFVSFHNLDENNDNLDNFVLFQCITSLLSEIRLYITDMPG